MWDLIVSVPDHCLSFYFTKHKQNNPINPQAFGQFSPSHGVIKMLKSNFNKHNGKAHNKEHHTKPRHLCHTSK